MVKAFLDDSLTHHNLTSANSINIARWLPQMFYFFFLLKGTEKKKGIGILLSKWNFGNICAGIMAKS
jgi:threonine synthase